MHNDLKGYIYGKSYYWRVELGLSISNVLSSVAQSGSFHCMVLSIPIVGMPKLWTTSTYGFLDIAMPLLVRGFTAIASLL